jgi:ribosomal protein S18 acetylase RimI-like enzyme
MYSNKTLSFKKFNATHPPTSTEIQSTIDFLATHLEQFGDQPSDIRKAIEYALNSNEFAGGQIIQSFLEEKLVGAVVLNKTGMKDYIPENILVYIATHADFRGKGIGKQLMQEAIQTTEGNIALHVEPENPAKKLYEKLGFTNKYLEMRLSK